MNRIATQRAVARPALREAALAVSLAVLAWPALAQDAPKDKSQLDTVTITAERRVENIKDVPNAVSQISGEKLDVLNSSGQDIRFLSGRVPSLNIESSFGRAFPRFYIRGYGNTDFRLNASQPVSLVYDDVVQENPILKGFPAFDLAAIEVVAGPQGTLYGRNTPAGVVKFDSVKPSQRQEGYVNFSYGTYGTMNLEGAANVPLTGEWSARISAQVQHRDDWVKNQAVTGKPGKLEGYDDRAIRIQALYEPHKDFSALFNVHGRDLSGSARLFRSSIIKTGTHDLVDGFDPEKAYTDGVNEQTLHATGGSARLRWGLGAINLYSITGYESVRPFSRGDVDGGYIYGGTKPFTQEGQATFPGESSSSMDGHRQITQEFRVESAAAGPLRWQGGVYFFDERYTARSTDYTTATGLAAGYVDTHQKNTAWATFGSVNYAVTQDFQLRGGLRFTKDKKDVDVTSSYAGLNTSTGVSAKTSDSKWNWDVSGSYALTKNTNLYARVATGFRASSVQGASLFAGQSQASPENVTSYEIGVKSDLWDRRARLSASVFDYTVKDLQLTAVGGQNNANRLLNAKKATGNGVELNLELLPVDQLLITLGGSLNNTKIRDTSLSLPACGGGCTMLDPLVAGSTTNYSINGNSLPNAPKWVGNLTARYSIPTPAGNEFYIYTDWAYRSKVNFFLYEAKEFTGKSLTEGGLRVGYVWNNGKYEAATFVRNITNQIRVTGAIDFNNNTGFINDPRTYGVQFKALF
ncbi:TonB-dependent receptor [Roseateles amylovorans]|uniref:TonB-dependent receptor n=1 Tax=Roseateles amylovorans TaxID=2978473 RepID=A0ABY6AYE8_9BURK|nr:TonB-dependent receptor [Roseateles amylovorans]UXH78209.1 TonB-dependent receptor [Roseateles amylovorans]